MVAALIGFGWWWFLNHAQTTPSQNNGSFGTSPNKTPGGNSSTTPTNIGSPVIGSGQPAKNIPGGKYAVQGVNGQPAGNYAITPAGNGAYVVNPLDGAGVLGAGNYTITIDNVTSNYLAAPVGTGTTTLYTIELAPYGTGGNTGVIGGSSTTTIGGTYVPGPNNLGTTTIGGFTPATTTDIGLGNFNTGGVDWLTQTGGSVFNPTPINQINGSNSSGVGGILPNIGGGNFGSGGGGGLGLGGALLGAAAGGAVSCAGLYVAAQIGLITPNSIISVQTNNGIDNGKDVLDCITRGIARAVVQQLTVSVVNWINNGFNGSPAFVTNPTQFFTNVADQAAGNFIKGGSLSFLCSPFQLQIRIAIAQSYANRNANSCTLTRVMGNINSFMNGNFSAGGWPGFLDFTTVPTNNPYGAYAYGQVGLSAAVAVSINGYQTELFQGQGFLTFKKKQNCTTSATRPADSASTSVSPIDGSAADTGTQLYEVCDVVSTTPGSVIASSINNTLNQGRDSLNLAKSFDEIIGALITQLMTRALQGGLSNLSGSSGNYADNFYTSDQLATLNISQNSVAQMQDDIRAAQQYASLAQGSINDIQNSQAQAHDLYNCWNNRAAQLQVSAATNAAQSTNTPEQALLNAQQASSTFNSLQARVDSFNDTITTANNSIVLINQFESRALSAGSSDEITAIQSEYTNAKNSGQIFTAADVVSAQQDRTTLQSQLNTLNQQTAAGIQQCNAF